MFSVYHDQKDGSDFSDVTLASEDDTDNSDLIECDQEVDKTPIEDYILTIIFNRSLQLLDHIHLNPSYHYHPRKQE